MCSTKTSKLLHVLDQDTPAAALKPPRITDLQLKKGRSVKSTGRNMDEKAVQYALPTIKLYNVSLQTNTANVKQGSQQKCRCLNAHLKLMLFQSHRSPRMHESCLNKYLWLLRQDF
jgi:hypothetical protein